MRYLRPILLIAFLTLSLRAAVWTVPDSLSSIQEAVDTAASGDTVLVMRSFQNDGPVHIAGKTIALLANNYIKNPGSYNFSTGVAIYNDNNTLPLFRIENADGCLVRGVLFDRSGSENGGGIQIVNSQDVHFDGTYFRGNALRLSGSGMHLRNSRLYSYQDAEKSAVLLDASGLYISESILRVQSAASLFSLNNSSTLNARNLALYDNDCENAVSLSASAADLDFVTFYNNTFSGNAWEADGSSVRIRNSILDHPLPEDPATFTVSYSALQQDCDGAGNIRNDPQIDPDDPFPVLLPVSPCISGGDPDTTGIPRKDLAGEPRPSPEWAPPDIGAFESERHVPEHGGSRIWVAAGGDDTWGNGSPERPFASVQSAVDIASGSDTVLIESGSYRGSIRIEGKTLTLASTYIIDGDSSETENTVLLGDTSVYEPVLTLRNADSVAVLGLSLREGSGRVFYPGYTYGGAVYCENSTCYLEHVSIEDNTADFCGGGIYALASTLRLHGVTFENNRARLGGALGISGSILKAAHTSIYNNTASSGGGIYAENLSRLMLYYSDISSNSAEKTFLSYEKPSSVSQYGGGIYTTNTDLRLMNSLLSENHAENRGAALAARYGNIELLQSTIAGNTYTADSAGTLYLESQHEPVACVNSIIWNSGGIQVRCSGSGINISHSDLRGGVESVLCENDNSTVSVSDLLQADPLFEGHYSLSSSSPCRDAGTVSFTQGTYYLINYDPSDYSGTSPDLGHLGAHPEIRFEKEAVNTSAAAYPQRAEHLLAYPNPFNAETHFLFSTDRAGNTVLEVYDVRGRKVKTLLDDFLLPGRYRIPFHAAGLPSGVYLCRLQNASAAPVTKKVLLLK